MKKIIVLLATLLIVACGRNKIADLKMNVDKPIDVESKFGKPDSIVRKVFMGISAEFWAYHNDSICLLFHNDILVKAQPHCYNGFVPSQEEKEIIEAQAKHYADSISEVVLKEMEKQ